MPLAWGSELVFWLRARGHDAQMLSHVECASQLDQCESEEHWCIEAGTLRVDGVEYPFEVTTFTYGYASVYFEGVPGVCTCPDQQFDLMLPDHTPVSGRHPGLRWVLDGRLIDADEMYSLWRQRVAFPWEMACVDADGNTLAFMSFNTNAVDTDAVLSFISPHVDRVRRERALRQRVAARRIQAAWLVVSYDPFSSVGKRVLKKRALCAQDLLGGASERGEWSEC